MQILYIGNVLKEMIARSIIITVFELEFGEKLTVIH